MGDRPYVVCPYYDLLVSLTIAHGYLQDYTSAGVRHPVGTARRPELRNLLGEFA